RHPPAADLRADLVAANLLGCSGGASQHPNAITVRMGHRPNRAPSLDGRGARSEAGRPPIHPPGVETPATAERARNAGSPRAVPSLQRGSPMRSSLSFFLLLSVGLAAHVACTRPTYKPDPLELRDDVPREQRRSR